jgi:hypothetical protein
MAAVPIYVWNGTAWQETGPTIPANPIKYQASAPSSPSTGDIWVDSDGDVTTGSQQFQRFRFVASGGETTISGADANGAVLAYTAGLEQVVLNGAVLVRGHDYTATTGTTITGLSPALVASDVLEVFSFIAFTVANTYTQSQVDGFITLLGGTATAWTSYTPALTASGTNPTLGSGSVATGKYKQIGKTVFGWAKIAFGTSGVSAGSGILRISLPIAAASAEDQACGTGILTDSNANTAYTIVPHIPNTGYVQLYQHQTSGATQVVFNDNPITVAASDRFLIHFTYEVA